MKEIKWRIKLKNCGLIWKINQKSKLKIIYIVNPQCTSLAISAAKYWYYQLLTASINPGCAAVNYVVVDFSTKHWYYKLEKAGYDPSKKSIF